MLTGTVLFAILRSDFAILAKHPLDDPADLRLVMEFAIFLNKPDVLQWSIFFYKASSLFWDTVKSIETIDPPKGFSGYHYELPHSGIPIDSHLKQLIVHMSDIVEPPSKQIIHSVANSLNGTVMLAILSMFPQCAIFAMDKALKSNKYDIMLMLIDTGTDFSLQHMQFARCIQHYKRWDWVPKINEIQPIEQSVLEQFAWQSCFDDTPLEFVEFLQERYHTSNQRYLAKTVQMLSESDKAIHQWVQFHTFTEQDKKTLHAAILQGEPPEHFFAFVKHIAPWHEPFGPSNFTSLFYVAHIHDILKRKYSIGIHEDIARYIATELPISDDAFHRYTHYCVLAVIEQHDILLKWIVEHPLPIDYLCRLVKFAMTFQQADLVPKLKDACTEDFEKECIDVATDLTLKILEEQ